MATSFDLSTPRRVHLVGIGGAGMSGIARILLTRGHRVSGSDLSDGRALDALRALGAVVTIGHTADAIGDAEVVVRSTAVPAGNPELRAAAEAGLLVLPRAEMLAACMAGERAVLVAGTHGKTTTTSMVVIGLQAAGLDPSFAIGGALNEVGTNAHAGVDALFVAEADESDRSLLAYQPDLALVTNVELDHPDTYDSPDQVAAVFDEFLRRRAARAPALVCLDDPGSAALGERAHGPVVTYGATAGADWRLVLGRDGATLRHAGSDVAPLALAVPGRHNLVNAAGAIAACALMGGDPEAAARGLATFTGAQRRFQRLGTAAGVAVVDDYAHHPTELAATLAAARTEGHDHIVLVVQPHRYSRTAVFGDALGAAAAAAEVIIVTEVYGAGEQPIPGVSGRTVADAAERAGAVVVHAPHIEEAVDAVMDHARPGTLVLVTGAGDVTRVGPAVLERLRAGPGGPGAGP